MTPANSPGDASPAEGRATRTGLFGRRKGKRLTARHDALLLTALPGIALDPSRPIEPAGAVPGGLPRSGSKSALAAANIWPRALRPNRRPLFLGCEAFHNEVAKALALIEEQGLSQHPAL